MVNKIDSRLIKLGKIAGTVAIVLMVVIVYAFLGSVSKYDSKRTSLRPRIADSPTYHECTKNIAFSTALSAMRDINAGGVELLLVNIGNDNDAYIEVEISDGEGEVIFESSKNASEIEVGEWTYFAGNYELKEGQEYTFTLYPAECEPYLMTVPSGGMDNLPYELGDNVSVGIAEETIVKVTYGDIFYFSYFLIMLGAVSVLVLIWAGKKNFLDWSLHFIKGSTKIGSYCGNDLFLIVVFIYVCLSIYVRAYMNGVCITADSSGYLREAVNMYNGYGMNFDGLAGYNSWFANWPVLYPLFICIMMTVTGQEAYLASKLLTMLCIGIILIILRIEFKNKAYIYSLCLLNLGFLEISYYTWSENLFFVFLLLSAIFLGKIISGDEFRSKDIILFGVCMTLTVLTRYFGIFLFFVGGIYIIILGLEGVLNKEKIALKKAIGLTATLLISGAVYVTYLFINKIKNGMPSGVSRSDWWDDYQSLTNDLIQSLLTEFFNVFHIEIPDFIQDYTYAMKAFLLIIILITITLFVIKNYKKRCNYNAYILISVVYYGLFIVIRYFSSMDTFYFRFFEPATFILSIGLISMVLDNVKKNIPILSYVTAGRTPKAGLEEINSKVDGNKDSSWIMRCLFVSIFVLMVFSTVSYFEKGYLTQNESYYDIICRDWDEAYCDIPDRSVIIFSDMDYRSEFYKPTIVNGELYTDDTPDSLAARYYGSKFLCIQTEYAKEMIACGEYDKEVSNMLADGLAKAKAGDKYMAIILGD